MSTVTLTPPPVFNPQTGVWSPAQYGAGTIPTLTLAQVAAVFTAKGQVLAGTGAGTGDLVTLGTAGQQLTVGGADASGIEWATA